jgi:hypothetical protein
MLKWARTIGLVFALAGLAPTASAAVMLLSDDVDGITCGGVRCGEEMSTSGVEALSDPAAMASAAATLDPPVCTTAGCRPKPPIEPPNGAGQCGGGISGTGGLFGSGMACRTNLLRIAAPAPEPGTLALLAAALLGLAPAFTRKRR